MIGDLIPGVVGLAICVTVAGALILIVAAAAMAP